MNRINELFNENFIANKYNLSKYFIDVASKRFYNNIPNFIDLASNQPYIIPNAEKICMHIFNLLGSGEVSIGKKINWHQDIKSKYNWPKLNLKNMKNYVYSNFNKGNDIRIPWELSRFYHLVPLSLAFYIKPNLKYLFEFENEIISWVNYNPVGYGINWFNAMEVSLRVCNWIFSFQVFNLVLASLNHKWNTDFVITFLSSINDHGNYILHNLENKKIKTNHYISNLLGLLYIGLSFPELKISKELIKFAIDELEKEIQNQVYEDGVDYELSISYHRFVTELFLYSSLLCYINKINLSNNYFEKMKKMIFFILAYTKHNGNVPNIGDNDNARLHIVFEDYYKRKANSYESTLEIIRMASFLFNNFIPKKNEIDSYLFKDSGFCVMKSNKLYLITGRGNSCKSGLNNHTHNDVLSFELSSLNNDFIIDPGTYIYTSNLKKRNEYRSTRMHNTVIIDNVEQNEFISFFKMKNYANLTINKWISKNNFDFLDYEHNGYMRLENPVKHRRCIFFNKREDYFLIIDEFSGLGKHKFEWNFHFSINIKPKLRKNFCLIYIKKEIIKIYFPNSCKAMLLRDYVYPSYGKYQKSITLRLLKNYDFLTSNKIRFNFKITYKDLNIPFNYRINQK